MKKKLIALLMAAGIVVGMTGCGNASMEQAYDEDVKVSSMFVELEHGDCWKVVYDKETKVMYIISFGSYNTGTFTVLVNADGSPKLYEGENAADVQD